MDLKAAGNGKSLAIGAAIIIVTCILAYMPAIKAGFIWDDDRYITENELLSAPDGLWRIWFTTDSPSQYFPLTYTSFRLEYVLWKLNPTGYHITNIILHSANVLLVWLVLRQLMIPGAWLAAMIFALHPVQVESVAWVTERKNVMMVFFALLSILAWVKFAERSHNLRPGWRLYILSLLLYVLALAAKSTACTLPVALLLVLWLKNISVNWKRWLQILPYLLLGLVAGLLAVWWENNHQGTENANIDLSLIDRFLIASRAIWFYIGKLLWPADLSFSYPQWKINSAKPLQYGWLAACCAVAFALWYWRKEFGKGAIAAVVFFAVTLLPVIGFINLYTFVYTYVADHYQYFASISLIALAAAIGHRAVSKLDKQGKNVARVLAGLILVTLAVLTYRQCHAYKDMESIWLDTLAKNQDSWLAYNNLGVTYCKLGRYEDAIKAHKQAIRLMPEWAEANVNLGADYSKLGRYEDAIETYMQTIRIKPGYAPAHYNLGVVYGKLGRYDEAIEAYKQAISLEPNDAASYNNLGNVYSKLSRYEEAKEAYRQATRIKPNLVEAHYNLGAVCLFLGDKNSALEQYKILKTLNIEMADKLLKLINE